MEVFIISIIASIIGGICGIFVLISLFYAMSEDDGAMYGTSLLFGILTAATLIPSVMGFQKVLPEYMEYYKMEINNIDNQYILEYKNEIIDKDFYKVFIYNEYQYNDEVTQVCPNSKLNIPDKSKLNAIQSKEYKDVYIVKYKQKYYENPTYTIYYPLNYELKIMEKK